MNNNNKKSYQLAKAVNNIHINRSTYTKDLKILKEQAKLENRTALEFCIWFDYSLVSVCNLNTGPFSAILELIDNKHILNNLYVKPFRLACLIFQEFVNSNNELNKKKVSDFLLDYPEYGQAKPSKKFNFDDIYNYDRAKSHRIMFAYLTQKEIKRNLISALIYRHFLSFDDKMNNLLFISQDDMDFHGLVKQGIREKHFMKPEFVSETMPFYYWQERDEKVIFKRDIKKVVFYDTTLYMLKKISYHIEDNVLYCSLHTPNASPNLYNNT